MAMIAALLLSATNMLPTTCQAALSNTLCSDCHTMHRSQQGLSVSTWGRDDPYAALLVTDCSGCHMGTNIPGSTPYVLSPTAPIYGATGTEGDTNTLAGGSFYWVVQGAADSKGHNLIGISNPDARLSTPPGFTGTRSAYDGSLPGGGNWPAGQQVSCAGIYGCHGSHAMAEPTESIRGGHHKNLTGAIEAASKEPARGYRMLVGILGYEDPSWELTPSANAHNQYKGSDRVADNSTISALCMRCHDDFHREASAGPWTAHPVDYDLSNTAADSEYRLYGGTEHDYQTAVPLASTNVSSPLARVSMLGGDAIVSCISCHRAHGSPYTMLLRWDYAGSNGAGCIVCHTSKS